MSTRTVTSAEFDQTVGEHDIVLVDFWASWCGPCLQFAPVFEAASERHDDIVFAKVDTDAERELAARAQISSIPTLMAFRDGICIFAQPGALPPAGLEQLIDAVRAVDMDDVRRQVADDAAGQAADEVDLETFVARHAEGGYVLDIREPFEYAGGHVPGAVPIPMNDVPARIDELPRDRVVHVICESGHRSRSVTDFLRAQGVDAVNVTGGTGEWAARGWALER